MPRIFRRTASVYHPRPTLCSLEKTGAYARRSPHQRPRFRRNDSLLAALLNGMASENYVRELESKTQHLPADDRSDQIEMGNRDN